MPVTVLRNHNTYTLSMDDICQAEGAFKEHTICLCTIGTRGDVLPFLYLAKELMARKLNVVVLTNENWRGMFENVVTQFVSVSTKDPSQSQRDDFSFFRDVVVPSFYHTYKAIHLLHQSTRNLCIVFRSGMTGASAYAERFKLPCIEVMLQPCQVKSFERPPWPMTSLAQSKFAALNTRIIIPSIYFLGEVTSKYRPLVNKFREDVKLPKDSVFSYKSKKDHDVIMFCPEWFAMPQRDWRKNIHCVGFPFGKSSCETVHGLEKFLRRYGKPIVFTPGTGVTNVDQFFSIAEKIGERLDVACVFLSQNVDQYNTANPKIFVHEFIELAYLLPNAGLLIHHGGIGTTAQAIRAGIPQIIVPNRFDQPDNASRIIELYLGGGVLTPEANIDCWVNLVQTIVNDDVVSSRVLTASQNLHTEHPVHEAANIVCDVILDRKVQ